jgi:hypothetical protein
VSAVFLLKILSELLQFILLPFIFHNFMLYYHGECMILAVSLCPLGGGETKKQYKEQYGNDAEQTPEAIPSG